MNYKRIVMLYDSYLEATRQVIAASVAAMKARDTKEAAKQAYLLAMLRVMYYEQFDTSYQPHSENAAFIAHQIENSWQLVGVARDNCDEAGFDWRSCEVPDLTAYINAKPQ